MMDANGNALSDAISGAMCWCPITALDVADEAYEWNMGQFYTSGTWASGTFTAAVSKDLADAFATFINGAGLTKDGQSLTLAALASGEYLSGSYYDYITSVVTDSLNNYLEDAYTSTTDKSSFVSGLGSYAAYDSSTDKAIITSIGDFIKAKKNASKSVGAFDGLTRGATENAVFRNTDATTGACHFDSMEAKVLTDNNDTYSSISGYADYRGVPIPLTLL